MHVWSKLSAEKWRDAWEERFHALEDTNLVISEFPDKKKIRVEVYCRTKKQGERIQSEWGGSLRKLANRDWVAMSAPEITPIKIRERFLITPERDSKKLAKLQAEHPEREIITIPAEMAFGTGDHATTATCLRFVCDLAAQGDLPPKFRCLDIGTGSGLLAIVAKKLGAGATRAWDYDPHAVRISKANAEVNSITGIRCAKRDVLTWDPDVKKEQYDLIFANVFYDVLTSIFPRLKKVMAPGGRVIISGILEDYAQDCLNAGSAAGIHFREVRQRGKWVTALGEHSTPQ